MKMKKVLILLVFLIIPVVTAVNYLGDMYELQQLRFNGDQFYDCYCTYKFGTQGNMFYQIDGLECPENNTQHMLIETNTHYRAMMMCRENVTFQGNTFYTWQIALHNQNITAEPRGQPDLQSEMVYDVWNMYNLIWRWNIYFE